MGTAPELAGADAVGILWRQVFEEMDEQLKTLLAQDAQDFRANAAPLQSRGGLRMGLGTGRPGLPPRVDTRKSQSAAGSPMKPHLEALAESLEKLQWTEQLAQLRHLTKIPAVAHRAWQPRLERSAVGSAEDDSDEAQAPQAPQAPVERPRDFRAEARSRAQARRRDEEDMQWLAAITAAENADSRREEVFQRDSDEEFYAELWGLHEANERRRRNSRSRRENPGLRTLRPVSPPSPASPAPPRAVRPVGPAPPALPRPRPVVPPPAPVPAAPTAIICFDGSGEVQCTICCEDFVKGDQLRLLPCLHRYHIACIDSTGQTCPVCKRNVHTEYEGD